MVPGISFSTGQKINIVIDRLVISHNQIVSTVRPILPNCLPDGKRALPGSIIGSGWLLRENFSTKFEEDGTI
jgi:hypothetical protein